MRVYFMGVCGTAMGNVALMLKQLGDEVIGADEGMYPPMSEVLRDGGVQCYEGYDPVRLEAMKPDLVVVGNVVSRGHPEMEWLLETKAFPFVSLPQLLSERILRQRRNIVVAGTHGKTTTTTLAATLLLQNGINAGYLIGGVPKGLSGGAELGDEAAPFVIEGDEYDSAFFDKRSKFIHYCPSVLILNNLEFDHADIFRDLEDVLRSFRHVTRVVPRSGCILLNGDDPNLEEFHDISWTQVIKVGCGEANDLRIRDFVESADGASFDLEWKGKHWKRINWHQHGIYNARNAAMAALAAGIVCDPENPEALKLGGLEKFEGVKRRQELLHSCDRLHVFEDFGHHPSAVLEALRSFRVRHPDSRIIACFEPRSNTARSKVFQKELPEALGSADLSLIGAVHRADKISDDERLDTVKICDHINKNYEGAAAFAYDCNTALAGRLKKELESAKNTSPSVVVFFSNGSFDGIVQDVVDELK